jgi:hypothetical protein
MFRSATTFLLLDLRGLTLSSLKRLFKSLSVLLKSFESHSIELSSDSSVVHNCLLWCANANKCNSFDLNEFTNHFDSRIHNI